MVLYFLQQRQPPVIPVLQEVAPALATRLRAITETASFYHGYALFQRLHAINNSNHVLLASPDIILIKERKKLYRTATLSKDKQRAI